MKNLRCQYGAGIKAIQRAVRGKRSVSNRALQVKTGLESAHIAVTLHRLGWKSVGWGEWRKA